ncbi:MAG: type II toxin-antitoxin system VapC family toxin [Chloroflexota bacterium]|nr:type II toxin-antitoxin system VapC family toxin [Chloroflexota bacterium]
MKYLLDTDVVIAALKNRPTVRSLLLALEPNGLAMSFITYGEVYEGIYFGTDPLAHEQGLVALLREVDLLNLNESIMQ